MPLRRAARLLLCGALAAQAVVATSCGDDGRVSERPGLTLKTHDFRFQPAEVPVPSGQVTLRLINQGSVTHNLSIPSITADIDLARGASKNVIFVAPASGHVEFFCKLHRDRGMTGAFIVTG